MELEWDKDNVLDTSFVNYAQNSVEENERDVLNAHISSKLETDIVIDGDTILFDDEIQSAKTNEIHKIELISNHQKQRLKAKADQEQFDLSYVPIK